MFYAIFKYRLSQMGGGPNASGEKEDLMQAPTETKLTDDIRVKIISLTNQYGNKYDNFRVSFLQNGPERKVGIQLVYEDEPKPKTVAAKYQSSIEI